MMLKKTILCMFAAACVPVFGGDFHLVKDGKAANIVIGEYFLSGGSNKKIDFSATEAFAATELADYTEKITGVRPSISTKADPSRSNIYLLSWFWASNPEGKLTGRVNQIKDDGFLIYAKDNTAYVIGKRPRGVLYGAYEVLKKYGDIRWILPGAEGEYYTKKDQISIPEQTTVTNPSFTYRRFNLVCANVGSTVETPKWMLRNNMQTYTWDCDKQAGGHVFSSLLPDSLFPEKPDLFGFYGGKRLPQGGKILADPSQYKLGGMANQPCTSNPETVRTMAENLVKMIGKQRAEEFVILNNDSTAWCECENCKKLDPPEEKKRGLVSTRFWLLANDLIEAGAKEYPNEKFITAAYQTFQEPPEGVVPDKRALIDFCVHSRCYAHDIGDERCYVNQRFRNLIKKWKDIGLDFKTYEYTDILPRGEVYYLPLEGVVARDLKYYKQIGSSGYCDEAPPKDGTYGKSFSNDRTVTESWQANFLVRYVQAYFMWNADADLDSVLEDIGSRYYGKAWPLMKEYRTLLRKSYDNVNAHYCYGARLWMLGKTMEKAGLQKKLNDLLDAALQSANGDMVLTKKIEMEKEYFRLTFEEAYKQFNASYETNSITAGKRKVPIEKNVDPIEKDWALADYVYVGNVELKFLYDDNNIHVYHSAGGKGAELVFMIDGKENRFPAELAAKIKIPYEDASEGESCRMGVLLEQHGKLTGWNGDTAATPPRFYRTVCFSSEQFIKNGDLADAFSPERPGTWKGNLQPRIWGVKGEGELVDGDAASGRNFVRGDVMLFQYLNGLSGPSQTYGIPKLFKGKLKVSAKYRGKGSMRFRLATSKLATISEYTQPVESTEWKAYETVFDCSANEDPLLLLYVFSHGRGMDLDDIRVTIQK